jgi:hypothetical protein
MIVVIPLKCKAIRIAARWLSNFNEKVVTHIQQVAGSACTNIGAGQRLGPNMGEEGPL